MKAIKDCPVPGRKDWPKRSRQKARLAIIAEQWRDGVDPEDIILTWGGPYNGMKAMMRRHHDIDIPEDMRKNLHYYCQKVYPNGRDDSHKSGWKRYEHDYYTREILHLNFFGVTAQEMLQRLDVPWMMFQDIINEQHLTRLQQEIHELYQFRQMRKDHPDENDTQIMGRIKSLRDGFHGAQLAATIACDTAF